MNVSLIGNNDGPLRLLRSMRAAGLEPVCIGIQKAPDDEMRAAYDRAGVPWFEEFGDTEAVAHLRDANLDLVVNAFCNVRFDTLLQQPYDVLNLHLAPLPAYRGRHPIQWALINGETSFGATIHRMTPGWDDGPILWQTRSPVDEGMSVAQLRDRLLKAVEADFGAFLTSYRDGAIDPQPNDDARATYVARRFPEDSRLHRWDDAAHIVRKVMALRSESYPAYVVIHGETVRARSAHLGRRTYVGVASPFVCGTESGLDVVCQSGDVVCLRDLTPSAPDVRVNDRLDLTS